MVKISVIVPVYNAESHLAECLKSIVNQTVNDLEIICINDGSTDSSLDVLNEYASRDDRIAVVNQENKGLGATRNVGLNMACGDYVYFMDTDGCLKLDALGELYSRALDSDADFVIFKLLEYDGKTRKRFSKVFFEMESLKEIYDRSFRFEDVCERLYSFDATLSAKFFKRDFASSVRFNEDLILEDNLFTTECLFKADKIYFHNKHLYCKPTGQNSIVAGPYNKSIDMIEMSNLLMKMIKDYGFWDALKEKTFDVKMKNIYNRFSSIDRKYRRHFINKIKKDFLDKKEEYERTIDFKKIDIKSVFFFYWAIESKSVKEFVLGNKIFIDGMKTDMLDDNQASIAEKVHKFEQRLKARIESKLVEIFWTGGFDSSFRITQLSRLDVVVQPYYMSDKRISEPNELQAIEDITDYLESLDQTRFRLLPLEYVSMPDRTKNKKITKAYKSLRRKDFMGTQYEWLAIFARLHPGIELSIHRDDKAMELILKHGALKEVRDDVVGAYYVIDSKNSSKNLVNNFEYFHFPLAMHTKREMRREYREHDLSEVMNKTWFCFTPVNGKPCGTCNPCKYTIEEGLKERFDMKALYRYYSKKYISKIKRKLKKK